MRRPDITLAQWIQEALNDEDKTVLDPETKKYVRSELVLLTLVHMNGHQDGPEIHTKRMAGSSMSGRDLAGLFEGKARGWAQDLPGAQQFKLYATYSGDEEPSARHLFTVEGKNLLGDGPTEEATARGQASQEMRWRESWMQLVFNQTKSLIGAQDYLLRTTMEENHRLRSDAFEATEFANQVFREQLIRDHDREHERNKYVRETQERKQLIGMAPMLINSVAGREVFPLNAADTALVNGLADKLASAPPDTIGKLMQLGIVDPSMMGPLVARLELRKKEKEKEKAYEESLHPPMKDVEAEVRGGTDPLEGEVEEGPPRPPVQ